MSKITKNSIIMLLCMLIHTFGTKLNSQPQPEFICGTCQEHTKQNISSLQHNSLSKVTTPLGGNRRRIPTDGTLKVLIIFAKFNDNNNWNTLPSFANSIIDSIVRPISSAYPRFSVSSFFKEMSNDSFNVIGKVYPRLITTNQSRSYYMSDYNYGSANLEVLKKVDSLGRSYNDINFNEFDNWTRDKDVNGAVLPGKDGFIDMVIIIYNDNYGDGHRVFDFTGIAGLSENLLRNFITKDNIQIGVTPLRNETMYYQASGITVRYTGENLRGLTNTIAHELGHYIGGLGHSEGYGFASGDSKGALYGASMSSIEKNHLGYLNFTDISPNQEYEARDYLSNNQAFRHVVYNQSGVKEWFIIENHQKVSDWDMVGGKVKSDDMDPYTGANPATVGKGLYIFRYYNINNNSKEYIYPIAADGRWD